MFVSLYYRVSIRRFARWWLSVLLAAGYSLPSTALGDSSMVKSLPDPSYFTAKQVLADIKAGNQRFFSNHAQHPHQSHDRLVLLSQGQHPSVAILACSDSRIAPELIFDQGLGDIFDIRVAGNIADDAVLGSLEYAVDHLKVPLVIVLGHQYCGAIEATLAHEHPHNHLNFIIHSLAPAVKSQPQSLEAATLANIHLVLHRVQSAPSIKAKLQTGELTVMGGYYRLETGEVEWLNPQQDP
jgi:carbonic anhydrase